ncbi:hypothetical protein GCM10027052_08790 [Parafrigoribacterium mesophilum]|uniref:hypothetical protein n=1 Tax=Parafrigoribacterium mesophilum TaxID=433646 RepID=UPI0031FC1711
MSGERWFPAGKAVAASALLTTLALAGCAGTTPEPLALPAIDQAVVTDVAPSPPYYIPDPAKRGEPPDVFAALGPAVPGEVRISGIGADIVPVRATAQVTEATARDYGAENPLIRMLADTSDEPLVTLARYTNVLGDKAADGSTVPSVLTQLAWVLEWKRQADVGLSHPMNLDTTKVGPPPGVSCDVYLVLSAADGEQLDAFRHCFVH